MPPVFTPPACWTPDLAPPNRVPGCWAVGPLGCGCGIWPRALAGTTATGSPPGPCTPGMVMGRVTVPYPPDSPALRPVTASGVAHPPPNPASSASVVAVRFIGPPSDVAPEAAG